MEIPIDSSLDMGEPTMDGDVPPMDSDQGLGEEPPMDGGIGDQGDGNDFPPMDDNEPNDMDDEHGEGSEGLDDQESSDDSELMDIINGLSIEDKAAVEKYAKSMSDDKDDTPSNDMPMESRKSYFKNLVDETINSYLYDDDDEDRVERLPKEYKNLDSPFKSPYE